MVSYHQSLFSHRVSFQAVYYIQYRCHITNLHTYKVSDITKVHRPSESSHNDWSLECEIFESRLSCAPAAVTRRHSQLLAGGYSYICKYEMLVCSFQYKSVTKHPREHVLKLNCTQTQQTSNDKLINA